MLYRIYEFTVCIFYKVWKWANLIFTFTLTLIYHAVPVQCARDQLSNDVVHIIAWLLCLMVMVSPFFTGITSRDLKGSHLPSKYRRRHIYIYICGSCNFFQFVSMKQRDDAFTQQKEPRRRKSASSALGLPR